VKTAYSSTHERNQDVRPLVDEVDQQREAVHSSKVPQLDETRASVVMNICESHQLGVSCDTEDTEGSRRVSGGPAQGGDVGATMETQCPVEDPRLRRGQVGSAALPHTLASMTDLQTARYEVEK